MAETEKLAEPEDVRMCYRLFLGREPESNDVIQVHLSNGPTIWQLVQSFAESKEYQPIVIDRAFSAIWRCQDGRNVRIEASATARAKILTHVEKIWSAYGTEDPYFSVLVNPAYRADSITPELTEQFYESGADGVATLKLAFERNWIEIDPHWHILELGCGLGRIGEHFCREFEYYYGIDISLNHLAHAIRRLDQRDIKNAQFMLLKEALQKDFSFDVFYSMIVLQHNPPPIMYQLLCLFLDKLKPGGYAFFQLPCHIYDYSFDADRYLAGEGKHQTMEMHALPQKYVFEAMYRHGLQPIEIWPFPVIGPIGLSYAFLARKTAGSTNRDVAPSLSRDP